MISSGSKSKQNNKNLFKYKWLDFIKWPEGRHWLIIFIAAHLNGLSLELCVTGLGMYETPLFLAHEEESGGRSVPTTPLQVAAPGKWQSETRNDSLWSQWTLGSLSPSCLYCHRLCGQALRVSVLPSDGVHRECLSWRLGARVPVRAHGHHLHRQPVHHHRARRRRRHRRGLRRGRVWGVKHHWFGSLALLTCSLSPRGSSDSVL